MTYAEVTHFGESDQLQFFEGPDPLVTEGKLLIEVQSAGVNFSDIMARMGMYPPIPSAPFRPGLKLLVESHPWGEG